MPVDFGRLPLKYLRSSRHMKHSWSLLNGSVACYGSIGMSIVLGSSLLNSVVKIDESCTSQSLLHLGRISNPSCQCIRPS